MRGRSPLLLPRFVIDDAEAGEPGAVTNLRVRRRASHLLPGVHGVPEAAMVPAKLKDQCGHPFHSCGVRCGTRACRRALDDFEGEVAATRSAHPTSRMVDAAGVSAVADALVEGLGVR